jgi:hypothetical protein
MGCGAIKAKFFGETVVASSKKKITITFQKDIQCLMIKLFSLY